LVQQISDYKHLIEKEKEDLELSLRDKEDELSLVRQSSQNLIVGVSKLEKEKHFLEAKYKEEIESFKKARNSLRIETIENLQTLMDELSRIEETNDQLNTELEKSKLQLNEERQSHATTLSQLVQTRATVQEYEVSITSLKTMNETLVNNLKQFHKATMALKTSQQLRSPSGPTHLSVEKKATTRMKRVSSDSQFAYRLDELVDQPPEEPLKVAIS
jgi:chromosome segregation ATPase